MGEVELRDVTRAEVVEAEQSGLEPCECERCEGEGLMECADGHPNDPNCRTFVDTCDACGGSGNGACPGCTEPIAFVAIGDGRCTHCLAADALELAEADESTPQPEVREAA